MVHTETTIINIQSAVDIQKIHIRDHENYEGDMEGVVSESKQNTEIINSTVIRSLQIQVVQIIKFITHSNPYLENLYKIYNIIDCMGIIIGPNHRGLIYIFEVLL